MPPRVPAASRAPAASCNNARRVRANQTTRPVCPRQSVVNRNIRPLLARIRSLAYTSRPAPRTGLAFRSGTTTESFRDHRGRARASAAQRRSDADRYWISRRDGAADAARGRYNQRSRCRFQPSYLRVENLLAAVLETAAEGRSAAAVDGAMDALAGGLFGAADHAVCHPRRAGFAETAVSA